jgi:hypothetical protein
MPSADDRISLYVMEPPFGPGRNALARLREMALSTAPREEVDAEFFRTLGPAGSDSFLKVSRSTIYRVGEEDYREGDEVLLCSHDDSIGYINSDGETVYWGGNRRCSVAGIGMLMPYAISYAKARTALVPPRQKWTLTKSLDWDIHLNDASPYFLISD